MALDGIGVYFHARVDLLPGKALPVSIEYEYGWAPDSISNFRSKQKSLEPYRELNPRSSSSQNSHKSEYATPTPISSKNKNVYEKVLM